MVGLRQNSKPYLSRTITAPQKDMNRLVILIILWCCSFTGSFAQDAKGLPLASSWNSLLKRAADNNKPIFIHVSAQWCSFCVKMDKETFADQEVLSRLSQYFIAA